MGMSLYNNSTNNLLNVALYGHGKTQYIFGTFHYNYMEKVIDKPAGLYTKTAFSHSRQRQPSDCPPVYDYAFLSLFGIKRKEL